MASQRQNFVIRRHWFARFSAILAIGLGAILCISAQALAGIVTKSGSLNVTARVPGPPPSTPSTIDEPTDGQVFTQNPVKVSGSCPSDGLIIKISDNATFVGSTFCSSGSYNLSVQLTQGQNTLVAQEFDDLNQQGPDSAPATVSFQPPAAAPIASKPNSPNSPTTPSAAIQPTPLRIALDARFSSYTGLGAGQIFSLPLSVTGGVAPFAVHIDWGDGTGDLISLKTPDSPLVAAHSYGYGGNYQVTITAKDDSGQNALLSLAVVINGKSRSLVTVITHTASHLWPPPPRYILTGSILVLLAFIAGRMSEHLGLRQGRRFRAQKKRRR